MVSGLGAGSSPPLAGGACLPPATPYTSAHRAAVLSSDDERHRAGQLAAARGRRCLTTGAIINGQPVAARAIVPKFRHLHVNTNM